MVRHHGQCQCRPAIRHPGQRQCRLAIWHPWQRQSLLIVRHHGQCQCRSTVRHPWQRQSLLIVQHHGQCQCRSTVRHPWQRQCQLIVRHHGQRQCRSTVRHPWQRQCQPIVRHHGQRQCRPTVRHPGQRQSQPAARHRLRPGVGCLSMWDCLRRPAMRARRMPGCWRPACLRSAIKSTTPRVSSAPGCAPGHLPAGHRRRRRSGKSRRCSLRRCWPLDKPGKGGGLLLRHRTPSGVAVFHGLT